MRTANKRYSSLIALALLCATSATGCSSTSSTSGTVLRILNAADYIYEGWEALEYGERTEDDPNYYQYLQDDSMIDQFIAYIEDEYPGLQVVYDTFETNETMFNELMLGKSNYDVICTSDYMVQKLITRELISPLYTEGLTEIKELIRGNVSSYMWNIFDNTFPRKSVSDNAYDESKPLSNYCVPYMWGTIGMMYNPAYKKYNGLTEEDVHEMYSSWDNIYNSESKIKGSFSIKDSVRDMYSVSVCHVYKDEIAELDPLDPEYNKKLNTIYNRCDNDTISKIESDLKLLKSNSFGFEVDNGKTDMAEGNLGGNLCWSGDAVYSINTAEEESESILYFQIPEGGSNLWNDCWCTPSKSQQHDLAVKFIEFMAKPENAIQNMEYVGYTSSTSSDIILDYVNELYCDVEVEDAEEYDISYFFDDNPDAIIKANPDYIGRQLSAQFPSKDQLKELCVMDDFGTQNQAVLDMWENVRSNSLPLWAVILFIVQGLILLFVIGFVVTKKIILKRIKVRRWNKH